jgi:hypothetical protein
MGIDKFTNFISKSINNDGIEEINIENNIRKIVANHIIFDLNFIMYQEIIEIESQVNEIIKIILCLPFAINNDNIIENKIKFYLEKSYWKKYFLNNYEDIFDGINENEIINKFVSHITMKNNEPSIIELIIYDKIVNVVTNYIEKIHQINFIQSISLFIDGIPSISKVLEQRRRRIKNYLESNEKKKNFKNYFDILENSHIKMSKYDSNLNFDYFKWIKNRFSIDKSIGPSTIFVTNLESFLNIKMKYNFPNIKININSGKENGESDLKIFNYISINQNIGDYCIHTVDSDLIHQMLVQQVYYKIINKDINLTVIKYIKNINLVGYVQVLEANFIIKHILELYNNINETKVNNYKIIWDLCFIFLLFGNDHLPASIEIGPELGLGFFINIHYNSLHNNNIINLKKSQITIDLNNLSLYLQKINETNKQNITKIILQRFFKINFNLINLFVDKFNFSFNEILLFLEKFIIYRGVNLSIEEYNNLDVCDLRKILSKNIDKSKYTNYDIFNFTEYKLKLFIDSINLIESNLDYYENEFNGLILYNRPINITDDVYQDLYNYISDKANTKLNNIYTNLYDHISINEHLKKLDYLNNNNNNTTHDYLKKLYHLTITQFGNMKNYHYNNLTYYKYYDIPSINNIILYILKTIDNDQTQKWLQEINNENIDNNYLNSISHHLLISPFITLLTDEKTDNLFNFKYKNIDINDFIKF